HLDLIDVVLDVQRLDARLEVGLHLVLVARVGVDDVPVARGDPQGLLHPLGRVLVLLGRDVGVRGRSGERVGGQGVRVAALDLGRRIGDLGARGDLGVVVDGQVGGVAGALGGTGLAGAGLDVGGTALVEGGVVEVGGGGSGSAFDRAVGLEGLAGVGHRWVTSLSGGVQARAEV